MDIPNLEDHLLCTLQSERGICTILRNPSIQKFVIKENNSASVNFKKRSNFGMAAMATRLLQYCNVKYRLCCLVIWHKYGFLHLDVQNNLLDVNDYFLILSLMSNTLPFPLYLSIYQATSDVAM